ncbi:MAG: alpha/beta fold hydrolase [Candidatus Rokubacteria bacterium]|nr:alpha/beta fold hydrolase [Candidatus Rokubacteria bacterium]
MTIAVERHAVAVPDGACTLALHLPESPARVPCVLACHGLGASKDSDKYLLLGEELPRVGLGLARFDFRGCGESTGVERDTTIATRIEDAMAVLERLAKHPRLDGRVGLLGSSMGGFVALHVAAARANGTPVVTWNAPSDFARLRRPEPPNGLGPRFIAEVEAGRYASTPTGVTRHLIVQAEGDDVVPPSHAATLHARAAAPKWLVTIPGADHRLTDRGHRRAALEASVTWFLKFLG